MKKSWPELKAEFPWILDEDEYFDIHGYKKRVEIFPGEWITAINKEKRLEDIWWTIEDQDVRIINARAETIYKKPTFRDAFAHDRILIPATGLYEWQVQPNKKKKRFEMTFDDEVFAFGGIAKECQVKGEKARCGVIITTHPNEKFKFIHNAKQRQAVVIREEDYEKWLDPATPLGELRRMMQPLPDEETHYQAVTEPVSEPDPNEDQEPLFK